MRRFSLATLGALIALSPALAQSSTPDQYRADAKRLADRSGYDVTYTLQCRTGAPPANLFSPGAPPATKLFDNLYYVGLNSVGAYIVKTSDGLILLDSLNNTDDVKNTLVPGMKALGLDPAQIKYVVISHAHGDHYGGARYIAETYKAHVLASALDWDGMEHPRPMGPPPGEHRPEPHFAPPPARDIVATDGQKLTLGDTTITLVVTPGHTPGTLSFIVPVYDHGRRHTLAMWGGTAIPNIEEAHRQYLASFAHFEQFTRPAGVDVELSNHPFVDGSLAKMAQLRANPDGPNPLIIGQARYADYTGILKDCALANPATAPARPPARP